MRHKQLDGSQRECEIGISDLSPSDVHRQNLKKDNKIVNKTAHRIYQSHEKYINCHQITKSKNSEAQIESFLSGRIGVKIFLGQRILRL